jgi:uncharacterized integral membrane protein (TIGR00698 family)
VKTAARILLPLGFLLCLTPFVSSALGLVAGIVLALTLGNPWPAQTKVWTPRLLQLSVIGLGFGMNLNEVLRVGAHGILYTVAGIAFCFALGTLLARTLSVTRDLGLLITVGTAICGGSAIAAVAPVIRAKDHETSVALATVFLLNAVGLLVFPLLGHAVGLDETRFGLWAALAIHDTSSVVGAARQYGPIALQIATTVKLARALWIVPVAFAAGWLRTRDDKDAPAGGPPKAKAKRPWFILGFLAAAALVSFVPALVPAGKLLYAGARQALVATLFLIGAGLSRAALKTVGVRPLAQGVALWVIVGSASLAAILAGWIR